MTTEEIKNCHLIDTFIRQNRSFALYRIPGETPRFVMQTSGSARLFYRIEELDGQRGFVIAPFRITGECPLLLIRPDCSRIPRQEEEFPVPEIRETRRGKISFSPEEKAKAFYASRFELFLRSLRKREAEKLVLSRHLTLHKSPDFSPAKTFYQASERYSYSYVYLFHTPQTGTWLGSTPEIILSGENGEWHTVALAGTQPLRNGELPQHWDEKNREEQQIVAAYIRTQLRSLGIEPEEEGPCSVRAGALSHLKSNFRFAIPDQRKLGDLLKYLHPTPAVCGRPKEESYRFILENEGYDRRYYSGFIGWLEPEGKSDLYVNLRCMHIGQEALTLYAGGGLLASSTLEDEWQETEAKLQTMRSLLASHT